MDLTKIVDIVSIVAVAGSLIFAGLEIRQYRLSRKRESAIELFNSYRTVEFARGIRSITKLPENLSKKQIEELYPELMDDIYFVVSILEGMGVLVQKNEISLKLIEDFFSGIIVATWLKLHRFVEDERKAMNRETWMEWTQWLAERIIERECKKPVIPAYIEYKDWKPS